MYDLIDSFLFSSNQPSGRYQPRLTTKARQTQEGYEIEMAAPGLSRSDFRVNVNENILTVQVKSLDEKASGASTLRSYLYNKTQPYRWKLPANALNEQITARYDAGILTVSIPAKYKENNKLEIKVS